MPWVQYAMQGHPGEQDADATGDGALNAFLVQPAAGQRDAPLVLADIAAAFPPARMLPEAIFHFRFKVRVIILVRP